VQLQGHRLGGEVNASSPSTTRQGRERRDAEGQLHSCPTSPKTRRSIAARSSPSSISPNRRRAIPRPAWSRSWRSSALAGPRPMPASSRCCSAQLRELDRKRFVPRTAAASSRLSCRPTSRATSNTLHAHLEESSTTSPTARSTGRQVRANLGRLLPAVGETKELRVKEVLDKLDAESARISSRTTTAARAARLPVVRHGRLGLKLRKFGAFTAARNYPDCASPASLASSTPRPMPPRAPISMARRSWHLTRSARKPVTLRNGPYGLYVQLGEAEGKESPSGSRCSGHDADEVT